MSYNIYSITDKYYKKIAAGLHEYCFCQDVTILANFL